MMSTYRKGFLTILGLIIITGVVLAFMDSRPATAISKTSVPAKAADGLVSISASLAQTKVLMGSDGHVGMSLQLKAGMLPEDSNRPDVPVDLVVVLDRSGSMGGQKISDARKAILELLEYLTPRDRLSLVTYANNVRTESNLIPMNGVNLEKMSGIVSRISSGGGTNLGSGLQRGMDIMFHVPGAGRQRKILLISDGQANQGIVDPIELGQMASAAAEHDFSVSTVGVGYDFNEVLMTTLADYGTGRYHFLENPQAFAQVFKEEFQAARQVAGAGLELRIPLKEGVRLVQAGGYPISQHDGYAVFKPGDLLSGQERNIFLTFTVPADREGEITFENIQVYYRYQDSPKRLDATLGLKVACVADQTEVTASIDKETWSQQVIQEEYNRLKGAVADAIRKGEPEEAMDQIERYETHTRQLNATVGSAQVQQNIDEDLVTLREKVEGTFVGAPAAVEVKRKQQSKALQYDSYKLRRDNKK